MRALKGAIAVAVLGISCGSPNSSNGQVDPTGGEVCLPDNRVCISVPSGGVDRAITLGINPTSDVPGGMVGEGYEITPSGTTFLKPATVTFKYDFVDDGGVNPLLL